MEIKEYLEKRINKKLEELENCSELTLSMLKGSQIEERINYLDIHACISTYKSLSETIELLEIYTSNFNVKEEKELKKKYNKRINEFEEALYKAIKEIIQ